MKVAIWLFKSGDTHYVAAYSEHSKFFNEMPGGLTKNTERFEVDLNNLTPGPVAVKPQEPL